MRFLFFLFFSFFWISAFCQELPPIQNFYPKDYHGENQNWAISQTSEKLIYVANSKGLLEFNGASWKLYPSPNETIIRSVQVVEDHIYTGSFMEFGYWQKNTLGVLKYTSLSKQIGIDLVEDEEFWNIINIDDWIVFQSLKRIYIYNVNDGKVNTIDANNKITKIFKVDKSIYFQILGKGIYKIEYGNDFLVFDDDIVKNDEVINIFGNGSDLQVLTQENGFYTALDSVLVKSDISANAILSRFSFYDGIQLKDESFVLGTISNGLICLNKNGDFLYQIDQNNGLTNNTILAVFEDSDNNIWLGLDNGVSYVNSNAPYRVFNDKDGILGSIYTSAIHNGNLYLGTNQGLFYKALGSEDDFVFIKDTQGQTWSLKVIDNTLFCGHNSGTFIVKANRVEKIANIPGTWAVSKLNQKPNFLLQGNYDGLYVLEKTANSWKLRNKIDGFNNSSRYFETLGNKIFVNHEYNGVFELDVDDSFFKINKMTIDTAIKGSNSGIIKYNGDLLYSYKKGILKYNTTQGIFERDSLLSNVYAEEDYESGKLILDDKNNTLWVFTNRNISFISPEVLASDFKIRSIPLTKEMRNEILGYENIIQLDMENTYLIGTTSGYITVNIDDLRIKDFDVYIGSIINRDHRQEETFIDVNDNESFHNSKNNLEISFYAPEYNKYLSTHYQYQLLGIYDEWSSWSEDASLLLENLPYGSYTFKVRAKIGNTISKNVATYSFNISKPWYISNTMVTIYILGVLLFSFLMHNAYKRYYSKQRQKLIDKNKDELKLAQVQNEKEIIRIKNQQLEVEFKSKSKELAASTMSIIKKNELLTKIKNELNVIEDKKAIKPVIKIIDSSLKQNDDWELFQEAFNNADSEFLKNIKVLHPSLSPNDLKLCAYLRLNLSSKEIARLLNISPRSVEIKRYRLRKKLQLEHEKNLVNYILEL